MAAFTPRVVCFDLDGTVMLSPNSLQYLLELSHAPAAAMHDIDRREETGRVDWITADHERAAFIAGLPVAAVEQSFDGHLQTIGSLGTVLATLKAHGLISVLITAGPTEVAGALARRFAFDHYFGSDFETVDGVYTGRVTRHLGSQGKADYLLGLCAVRGISLRECVAVGDGPSDVDLFQQVGLAIGLNCSSEVARFARHVVVGDDLSAIVPLILSPEVISAAGPSS
jgi:phosphoserine phosphatase